MKRFEHLVPALCDLDAAIRVIGLDEGLQVHVARGPETLDGSLHLEQRSEQARRSRRFTSLRNKSSTALSHGAEIGVKWNVQRSGRPS